MLDYDYIAVDFISERLQSPFDYWKPFKTKKLIDRSEFNTVDENDMCPCKESKKIFKECCFNKEKLNFHIFIYILVNHPLLIWLQA